MTHYVKIKKALGLKSYSTVYKWAKKIHGVTPVVAKQLEEITGIDRRRFCWPEEFSDPWPEVFQKINEIDL